VVYSACQSRLSYYNVEVTSSNVIAACSSRSGSISGIPRSPSSPRSVMKAFRRQRPSHSAIFDSLAQRFCLSVCVQRYTSIAPYTAGASDGRGHSEARQAAGQLPLTSDNQQSGYMLVYYAGSHRNSLGSPTSGPSGSVSERCGPVWYSGVSAAGTC